MKKTKEERIVTETTICIWDITVIGKAWIENVSECERWDDITNPVPVLMRHISDVWFYFSHISQVPLALIALFLTDRQSCDLQLVCLISKFICRQHLVLQRHCSSWTRLLSHLSSTSFHKTHAVCIQIRYPILTVRKDPFTGVLPHEHLKTLFLEAKKDRAAITKTLLGNCFLAITLACLLTTIISRLSELTTLKENFWISESNYWIIY